MFAAAVSALDQLAAVPMPVLLRKLLPDLGVMLADDLGGWRRIADDPPGNLDAWTVRHLDHLRDLGDRAAAALTGDRLVHADIRADNLILMIMCRSTVLRTDADKDARIGLANRSSRSTIVPGRGDSS